MTVVLERKTREVESYAKGTHWPKPYQAADGWRCLDCLGRLREYNADNGQRRLRHYRTKTP